jgi:multiple sugar transport system ATP-binding protein
MTMGDRIVVLNKGFIQQVDSPQVLYDSPCNMFVAGFIGSPQMNFLDAVLGSDEKGFYLLVNEDKLYIPKSRAKDRLKDYVDKSIKMGIRPEDIHEELLGDAIINVEVEVDELMGNEVYLYLKYGDWHLTSRVPPTLTKAGDTIKVSLNMDKVHLFDIETEESLLFEG